MASKKAGKAASLSARGDKAPMSAGDVIKRHQERLRKQKSERLPSEDALVELEKLMAYSDTLPPRDRVRTEDALELLARHGWNRQRCTFERFMREHYGRKWHK